MNRIITIALTGLAIVLLAGCGKPELKSQVSKNQQVQQVTKQASPVVQKDEAQLTSVATSCAQHLHIGPRLSKDFKRFVGCVMPAGLSKQDETAGKNCLQSKVVGALTHGKQAAITAAIVCLKALKVPGTPAKAGA